VAKIILWENDDVVRVPMSSLFRHGDGWAVFRVEHDKAILRPASIGHRNALFAEVLEGLEPDDTVVAHPSDKVKDGATIVRR
jgi:HlyD family secretion protein